MTPMLEAEAAAAFDDLTMTGRDALLTEQSDDDWPNIFRIARFYPAVEYIQAMRARSLAVQQVSALFEQVDIIVTHQLRPQLVVTNLTGHPALIVPNGLRGADAPRHPAPRRATTTTIGGPGTPVSHHLPRRPLSGREALRLRPRVSASYRLPEAPSQAGVRGARPLGKWLIPQRRRSGRPLYVNYLITSCNTAGTWRTQHPRNEFGLRHRGMVFG